MISRILCREHARLRNYYYPNHQREYEQPIANISLLYCLWICRQRKYIFLIIKSFFFVLYIWIITQRPIASKPMACDSDAPVWLGHADSERDGGTRSVALVLGAGIDNALSTTPWQYAVLGSSGRVQRGLRPPSTPVRTPPVSAGWTVDVGTHSTIHPW